MRKIPTISFLLSIIILILNLAGPATTLAAAPACDPTKVDLSSPTNSFNCDSWTSTGSQSKCDMVAPGTVYCDAGQSPGLVGSTTCCWKTRPTATTKSPQCPTGYIDPTLSSSCDSCCTPDPINNTCEWAQTPPGQRTTCDYLKTNAAHTTPKDSCPADGHGTYSFQNGICTVSGLASWDFSRINKCDNGTTGIQTAIGCIPTENITGANSFLNLILKFALGISGAVVLFMIIYTGYMVLTSSGNPDKLQAAKENVVSIFSGLILIAFSLVLLQTIGVSILQLPGF